MFFKCRWGLTVQLFAYTYGKEPTTPQLVIFVQAPPNISKLTVTNGVGQYSHRRSFRISGQAQISSQEYSLHTGIYLQYTLAVFGGARLLGRKVGGREGGIAGSIYKFKRIVGNPNFSDQFKKIVKRYIRVGYNLDIMRQSACLVLNPITVHSYGFLFNCTTVGQASDSMTALT